ncbi:MAG: radical SAM protein [Candidatus Aminicenantes bacterium]|nr:radical SAM protein [Candidatus Aminicenantes bacterium]
MNSPKYKTIKRDKEVIIFFPQSMKIITMNPEEYAKTTEAQILECSGNFLDAYNREIKQNSPDFDKGKHWLYKIMLDVTDDCLLDCRYCYASKYHEKVYMSQETIDKVIAKFFVSEKISWVNRVVFFGGEPLLNLAGMEYFIDRTVELQEKGSIERTPSFNIITGGAIYSQRISQLFKNHKMGILVSCDGPPELQNEQRPFRGSGKGSWDTVAGNIKEMVNDGLNISIECTITKRSIELGYNHRKLKDYFLKEFGLGSISFVPEMTTNPEKIFRYYPDFYGKENIYYKSLIELNRRDELFEIPQRLLTKKPLLYACGLGRSSFHILANGDIYPCQLIAGMEEYKLTDIDSFNDSYFDNNNWIERYEKHSSKCDSCWAKPLCKFCPARQLIESNSYTLPEPACVERRNLIEDLIVKITGLRKDPERWNDFSRRLEEKAKIIEEKIYSTAK